MLYKRYASEIYYITKKASDIIMSYYSGNIHVMEKQDDSPVTHADMDANKYIVSQLQELTPDIPIVSEENSEADNKAAAKGGLFWLVDPLDGTKSFIKKTGEFTVNIALVQNGGVLGGAIYLPAKNIGYFTAEDGNAYKQDNHNLPVEIRVRPKPEAGITVIASHSHRTAETNAFIESLDNVHEIISASSSIKLCLVAEGKADIYPRFGRTMEWDIGAGQAILEAAGGSVLNIDGSAFIYGKDGFENPNFIAKGNI